MVFFILISQNDREMKWYGFFYLLWSFAFLFFFFYHSLGSFVAIYACALHAIFFPIY